jgi:hypothetical protein
MAKYSYWENNEKNIRNKKAKKEGIKRSHKNIYKKETTTV